MQRAHCLDALRLLASLALAIGHLTTAPLVPGWMSAMLLGGLSSATFFILSGFVVVSSSSFWELPATVTLKKRLMRLLPPHWIGFLIALPGALFGASRISLDEFWITLAWWLPGMQNFATWQTFSEQWNPPAWALTPLLIGGVALVPLRWMEASRWGLQALVGLLCLTVLARVGLDLIPMPPLMGADQMMRHSALVPRLLEVLAGSWAGLLWIGGGGGRIRAWLKRDLALILTFTMAVALLVLAAKLGGREAIYLYTHGLYLPLGLVLVASAYANEGWLWRSCSHPWIVHGGKISIYIWMTHIPVSAVIRKTGYKAGMSVEQLNGLWVVALTLGATIALASLCERFIRFPKLAGQPIQEIRAHAAG